MVAELVHLKKADAGGLVINEGGTDRRSTAVLGKERGVENNDSLGKGLKNFFGDNGAEGGKKANLRTVFFKKREVVF